MQVQVTTNAAALQMRLEDLARSGTPQARREMLRNATAVALEVAASATPVKTGRARDSLNAALASLNGIAGAGDEGSAALSETNTTSEVVATSYVPYMGLLEFGARRRAGRGMLRRGLAAARQALRWAWP